MPLLVAFLRGINVGRRIVRKEKLQEAFTTLGFQNVCIYKQTGNVIFETFDENVEEIRTRIEDKLLNILGYNVSVFIRSISKVKEVIESNPFEGQSKEGRSFLVTFLAAAPAKFPFELPMTIPKSTAEVISAKGTEVFSVTHGGGEGALPNPFLESKLKEKATTRNLNTIREIVEKYSVYAFLL